MELITVKPVEGRLLPLETLPSRRITQQMQVPDTEYYRRAIARGDIERVTDAEDGGN